MENIKITEFLFINYNESTNWKNEQKLHQNAKKIFIFKEHITGINAWIKTYSLFWLMFGLAVRRLEKLEYTEVIKFF